VTVIAEVAGWPVEFVVVATLIAPALEEGHLYFRRKKIRR